MTTGPPNRRTARSPASCPAEDPARWWWRQPRARFGTARPPRCSEPFRASCLDPPHQTQGDPVHVNTSAMPSATADRVTTERRLIIARAALYLGALAVLATGVLHIQQYSAQNYSTIPTIGTLFFLNFVSAVVIAVGL